MTIIASFFAAFNEILATGIVIVATSLLLYNITRNQMNRVARASGIVLASVTLAYLVDVFLSLGPSEQTAEAIVRLQWIGIAFIPSALFHLSDALLATTGLPSRGRRRLVVRLLYIISTVFLILATLTDNLATPVSNATGVEMRAQEYFVIYLIYFLMACAATFINLNRARIRCMTIPSRRRMAYLQFAILTPAFGIFPYSALFPVSDQPLATVQLLVNIANIIVITMLIFLSYPLSFFGSDTPDRVVKVDLLRFLLRGPGTALMALASVIFTGRATAILGLAGEDFTPFAVVAVVLIWQWGIHLALPTLEKWLIYREEDDEQLVRLQNLSDRVLTHGDLVQLIGATAEALCEYLRTEVAFVITLDEDAPSEITYAIGDSQKAIPLLNNDEQLLALAYQADRVAGRSAFQSWQGFYIVPLYSNRPNNGHGMLIIGILAIQTHTSPILLVDDEDTELLYSFVQRIEQTLDDILLQNEIFGALEGLLPQISTTRKRADEVEYRPNREKNTFKKLPNREEAYEQVRAALRHYWGGPGIARSRLMDFKVVEQVVPVSETPIQALRTVLQQAIERLRPETERSMTAADWTLYNIIELRFIEGKKVRDVARRMSLSEADLYRKQRLALEAVAESLLAMEEEAQENKPLD